MWLSESCGGLAYSIGCDMSITRMSPACVLQRCHCLGFLPRSWVFRSNLGFLGFFLRALGFFKGFRKDLGFFLVFFKFARKYIYFCCFLQKVIDFRRKMVKIREIRVKKFVN